MRIGLPAGAPARFLDESFISAEGIEVQIAFGDSPMENRSKEKEKATILANASHTVAERRGIGGYVEASNSVAENSKRGRNSKSQEERVK